MHPAIDACFAWIEPDIDPDLHCTLFDLEDILRKFQKGRYFYFQFSNSFQKIFAGCFGALCSEMSGFIYFQKRQLIVLEVIMKNSEKQQVAMIQLNYPPGTRLILDHMDDPYAPVESGTRGSVQAVDDAGQIHMAWDNGRTLAVIPGVDIFRKLTPQELAEEQQRGHQKPDCPLIGQNGNIYNLMGIASDTLRKNGQAEQALNVIGDFVNITSIKEVEEQIMEMQ